MNPAPSQRKKILFVAEPCTMAHVIRPLVLAKSLDSSRYEVHFACAQNDLMQGKEFLFEGTAFTRWELHSQPSAAFLSAMAEGDPLFSYKALAQYLLEDKKILEQVNPDVVVSDMRLTLSSAAQLCCVPSININNVHWSEASITKPYPIPETPIARLVLRNFGTRITSHIANALAPYAMRSLLTPINRLRREYQLPPYRSLQESHTAANTTLYADIASLIPTHPPIPQEYFLGPITWSPDAIKPEWWDRIPTDRPIVYVALGSSGDSSNLPTILEALVQFPVAVLAAAPAHFTSERVYAAPYFPWQEAMRRSSMMICNGGSGPAYAGLSESVPILGICSNYDQLMFMTALQKRSAGLLMRASNVTVETLSKAVRTILTDDRYRQEAKKIQREIATYNAGEVFANAIENLLDAWGADTKIGQR